MHLTDLSIRALPFVQRAQRDYSDDAISGLLIRVGKRTKTFMLVIGSGKARKRLTIGRYNPPHFGLAQARSKAKEIIGKHQRSHNEATTMFIEALERFMQAYNLKNKSSTVEETERLLKRHLKPLFEKKQLGDIKRGAVVELVDSIEATSERRHLYTAAHTFFRWARRYGISNPLEGVEKPPKGRSRDRLLTPEEFKEVWMQCGYLGSYGRLVRLLFATGQRLGQIVNLSGSLIQRGDRLIVWPPALMKHKREHVLPYSDLTHSLLGNDDALHFTNDSGEPFTSWSNRKARLDQRCKISHWTLHDARRFFSSTHSEIGTPPHIREMLLAHSVGSHVSQIYDRYTYLAEKREAARNYEGHLTRLLA
jgi:integrase